MLSITRYLTSLIFVVGAVVLLERTEWIPVWGIVTLILRSPGTLITIMFVSIHNRPDLFRIVSFVLNVCFWSIVLTWLRKWRPAHDQRSIVLL
jgi:hypothetical protein